jgi:predicted transcriptional regulator
MSTKISPLELENRRIIFQLIDRFPGIHFRELFRKLNISMGSFEYHLNILERNDLIYLKKEGHYTRYFTKGKLGEEDKKLATMLRNDRLRKMLFTLILNPGMSHKSLSMELGWPKSTTSFYLKKLLENSVVEERTQSAEKTTSKSRKATTGIYVIKPDRIIHLVVLYKSGFFDELSNRILDLVEVL